MKEDVKTNISEEEIVLAPPTELFDEAKDIAQNTTAEVLYGTLYYYPLIIKALHLNNFN